VAVLLLGVVAVDTGAVLLHDDATPYGAGQAVADFRRQHAASGVSVPSAAAATATSTPSAAPSTPVPSSTAHPTGAPTTAAAAPRATPAPPSAATLQEGVYSYATSGHEEVDILGGARHDYPDQTTVTYQRGGCGDEDRWQPLKERYSANTVCRGAHGLEARSSVQRHQFFGQSDEQVLTCAPGLVLVPDDPRAGQVFTGECRSADTDVRLTIRVRELVTLQVGGRSVPTVHISVDGQLSGSSRGTNHREEWFTRAGMLVRGTASTESDRDTSAGVVHYSEVYELRLGSLDPQR
jgi:hypothetical protein